MSREDLTLLPQHLAAASLSNREIVLTYEKALQAIDIVTRQGAVVFCWEGWLELADGGHTHSPTHQGILEIAQAQGEQYESYAERAASAVRTSIAASQERWCREPEFPGAKLYYCLSVKRGTDNRT